MKKEYERIEIEKIELGEDVLSTSVGYQGGDVRNDELPLLPMT